MPVDSVWGNIFKKMRPLGCEPLATVPIFAGLGRKDLNKLSRIAHRRTYAPQEVIFKENEPGVAMYIIERGSVNVVEKTLDGAESLLAHLEAGEFFGELSMLDGCPRSASAVAVEDSDVIGFCWSELHQLIRRNPALGVKVLLELARTMGLRLRHTNQLLKRTDASRVPPDRVPAASERQV